MLAMRVPVYIYGSEGWGFESLRARPGHRPLPALGRGLFRAAGSHVGSHSSRFRPKQRLAHGRGDSLPAQPAADQLVLPTPNRGADSSSSPTTVQLAAHRVRWSPRWRQTGMADHAGKGTA